MLDAIPTPPESAALLAWYDRHQRILPWRAPPGQRQTPYRVWLSEVMLQQTTVKAVIPYFLGFTKRWPDVNALAAAPENEVMAAWAGLGYYSRARKLIECARAVANGHSGVFPDSEAALLELPGIGPYTAAAIAAIAFDRPAVVVDGNVERVITRLHALEDPLPGVKAEVKRRAGEITPRLRPGDHAQAMMDLGATICTPKKPACGICPVSLFCRARGRADVEGFPRKAVKAERPLRQGLAFVIRRGDEILLTRRPPKGLLGGMAALPSSEWRVGLDLHAARGAAPLPGLAYRRLGDTVSHVFTHFELKLSLDVAEAAAGAKAPDGFWWHAIARLGDAGLPSVMAKAALAGVPGAAR